jgi:hypothetical protein
LNLENILGYSIGLQNPEFLTNDIKSKRSDVMVRSGIPFLLLKDFQSAAFPTVRSRSKIHAVEQPPVEEHPQQANLGHSVLGIALE